jgi:hypothetical protein
MEATEKLLQLIAVEMKKEVVAEEEAVVEEVEEAVEDLEEMTETTGTTEIPEIPEKSENPENPEKTKLKKERRKKQARPLLMVAISRKKVDLKEVDIRTIEGLKEVEIRTIEDLKEVEIRKTEDLKEMVTRMIEDLKGVVTEAAEAPEAALEVVKVLHRPDLQEAVTLTSQPTISQNSNYKSLLL